MNASTNIAGGTAAPCITLASGRRIGPGCPCFVVAEVGNNHQGDMDTARRMVREAARAGADAVKFQKRDTSALLTTEGARAAYGGPNSFGATYGEHRDALELSAAQFSELKQLAESLGMVFFASAWDAPSLAVLADLKVELLKVCSADVVNVPILRRMAALNLPVVLSTGMSTLAQVDRAVAELSAGRGGVVVLHCNSSYPCDEADIALPVMDELALRYGLPVGYSGHERGIGPSVAAVARGACLVERHFTLDRTQRGTDHQASLEPDDLALLVRMIREVERAMTVTEKRVTPHEAAMAVKLRKSLVAARTLAAGTVLAPDDLTVKSPGDGLSPELWDAVIGNSLTVDLPRDGQLLPAMLAMPVQTGDTDEEDGTMDSSRTAPNPAAGSPTDSPADSGVRTRTGAA